MQKGNCPRVDRARLHLVLALALAAACGGQIQSDGVSDAKVQRAPVISHAEQYDQSGPLTLLRSEEHTSELQSPCNLVCRLLLEKKKKKKKEKHVWMIEQISLMPILE